MDLDGLVVVYLHRLGLWQAGNSDSLLLLVYEYLS